MLNKLLRQPEPGETMKPYPSSSVLQSMQVSLALATGLSHLPPIQYPPLSRILCKHLVYHTRFLPAVADSCPIGFCPQAGEGGSGMSFSARHIIRGVARRSAMHAIRLLDASPAPVTGQVPGDQTQPVQSGSLVLSLLGLEYLSLSFTFQPLPTVSGPV